MDDLQQPARGIVFQQFNSCCSFSSVLCCDQPGSSVCCCRLLNRNAFKFTGGGFAAKLPGLLMKAAPAWAIHLGTQVGAAATHLCSAAIHHLPIV
jgi:hypothetical protein